MSSNSDICPKCGEELVERWMFNPNMIKEGNFTFKMCKNKDCKGWWCPACDRWHPYNTICANYEVGLVRGKYNYKHVNKDKEL